MRIKDDGIGLPVDAGKSQGVGLRMVANVVRELGRLDMLVISAVYRDRELFHQADMAGFRRTIDVTMWGAFYTLRAAANAMIRQGQGGSVRVRHGLRDGVLLHGSGSLFNSGAIEATGNSGYGAVLGSGSVSNAAHALIEGRLSAVFVQGGAGAIDNSGTLLGDSLRGVWLNAGGRVRVAAWPSWWQPLQPMSMNRRTPARSVAVRASICPLRKVSNRDGVTSARS